MLCNTSQENKYSHSRVPMNNYIAQLIGCRHGHSDYEEEIHHCIPSLQGFLALGPVRLYQATLRFKQVVLFDLDWFHQAVVHCGYLS